MDAFDFVLRLEPDPRGAALVPIPA